MVNAEQPGGDGPMDRPAPDKKMDALGRDWRDCLRAGEFREAEHHECLDRRRAAHDDYARRTVREAGRIEEIEGERLHALRGQRAMLDLDVTEAHEVAGRAFAELCVPYEPGRSGAGALCAVPDLHEADAAQRAGLPGVSEGSSLLANALKMGGMAGCLVLGTLGMGGLVLRVPPRMLLASPVLLPLAAGLGLILVGGAYLTVTPPWRRAGTAQAARPGSPEARSAMAAAFGLTALAAVAVASVDAKAILAIGSARAMVNPASAPSFAATFLVALALSAAYVVGAAASAFCDSYALEGRRRIEAERGRYRFEQLEDRRAHVEVQQAFEALNRGGSGGYGIASVAPPRLIEAFFGVNHAATQMRGCIFGISSPLFRIAVRTRSLLSCTALSGSPTSTKYRSPSPWIGPVRSVSITIGRASMPRRVAEWACAITVGRFYRMEGGVKRLESEDSGGYAIHKLHKQDGACVG